MREARVEVRPLAAFATLLAPFTPMNFSQEDRRVAVGHRTITLATHEARIEDDLVVLPALAGALLR